MAAEEQDGSTATVTSCLRELLANHVVDGLRSDAWTLGPWGRWRHRPSQGELGLRAGKRLAGNALFKRRAPSPGLAPTTSSAGSHPGPAPHHSRASSPQSQGPDSWGQPCASEPTEMSHGSRSDICLPCLSVLQQEGSCPRLLPRLHLPAGLGASLCGPVGRGVVSLHPLETVTNKLSFQQPSSPDLLGLPSFEFSPGTLCFQTLAAHAP